ncbi:type I restriction enzyme HsdR N-terminal domain-containing protein [Microcoleus sp. B4-D4]|uniref:type I restriction enzyme HsdR N-terminal domain-containing protein n=1 Tax=Microcoleus sp. B4-D4 TaxID=2818667 RepID=UPI002FD1A95A
MNSNHSSMSRLSENFYVDDDISQSLQKLLRVRPHEVEAKKTIILTTAPQLWNVEELGKSSKIIDLSNLIGIKSNENLLESELLNTVIEQFALAGWPKRAIFPEYRSDLKVRRIIDIAIFEPEDTWQIAVEIQDSERLLDNADEQIKTLCRGTTVKWLCATNGIQFKLLNRETNEHQLLDHAPSPTELGIHEWENIPQNVNSHSLRIFNPSSVEVLLAEVEESKPESLVIDFTIPWGFKVKKNSDLYNNVISQFINSLPINIREQMPGRIDILPVILAWAATIPSVKTLSAIVWPGIAINELTQWLRNCLIERFRLCSVLELPGNLFRFTSMMTSLLYFGGEREQVYFDVLGSRGDLISMDSRPWFDSLSKWMKGDKPSTGYTAKVENNANWAVRANDPEIDKTLERLKRLGKLVYLGELCDIQRGAVLNREDSEGTTPLIHARDLRGGYVDFENAQKIEANSIPEQVLLKKGDLLLPEISGGFSVALNRSSEPAVLGRNVIRLRLKDDKVSSEYLREYLNSSTAKKLISARVSTLADVQRITTQSLREFPVPVVDSKLYQGLNDLQRIEVELRAKADELESLRRALFDAQNSHSFQASLIELKRRGTLLETSLQSVDRLEFQIANFYPFPIAYGFRLLGSIVNPAQLYKEQLRVAENLLAFLGSISLALLQKQDRQKTGIDLKKYWQGGISPGHWVELVARSAKVFGTYKDDPLAEHIYRLNIGSDTKGFGSDVTALIRAKNNFKHDRGPTLEEEILKATQDIQERLKRCMEALAFFTEYPIRQVLDVNPSRCNSTTTLKCLRFIGDHPGLPQEEVILHKALHKGDLFLDAGRQEWVPLYPFINAIACSSCKTRETYFVDKWDNGIAYTKSFERGHTESCGQIAEGLADWGSNE